MVLPLILGNFCSLKYSNLIIINATQKVKMSALATIYNEAVAINNEANIPIASNALFVCTIQFNKCSCGKYH